MRVLMDACILFPTVLREILLGAAAGGGFVPLWSARILEEWRRAAARAGTEAEGVARAEIALLAAAWPGASVTVPAGAAEALSLPDPDDRHVLAAALAGGAEAILTVNLRDFPGRTLGRHGLTVRTPDSLMMELLADRPALVSDVVAAVQARTVAVSGRAQPLRPLLKRAGLPRLGKALGS